MEKHVCVLRAAKNQNGPKKLDRGRSKIEEVGYHEIVGLRLPLLVAYCLRGLQARVSTYVLLFVARVRLSFEGCGVIFGCLPFTLSLLTRLFELPPLPLLLIPGVFAYESKPVGQTMYFSRFASQRLRFGLR